jgi:hypothetical protein
MPPDSLGRPQLVKGLIIKDSKLEAVFVFLVIIFGATPTGALAVHAWWTGQLFFGMKGICLARPAQADPCSATWEVQLRPVRRLS